MERIEELLTTPDQMTSPQRRLWIENKDMIEGKLYLVVTPLRIRFHHFEHLEHIAKIWQASPSVSKKGPWEFADFNFFYDTASKISKDSAIGWSGKYERAIANPENFPELNEGYPKELIGGSLETKHAYQLSVYLYLMNFLLRAYRDNEQNVYLGTKPDLICEACKGGLERVGGHCVKIETKKADEYLIQNKLAYKRSFSTSFWIANLQETLDPNEVTLKIKYFFPNSVGSA